MVRHIHKSFLLAVLMIGFSAVTLMLLSSASSQEQNPPGLANEPVPATAVRALDDALYGKWFVRFTGGGRRTYRFARDGTATFVDDNGHSKNKQLRQFGKEVLLLEEDGDEVERLTIVDGRLFVEHRIRPIKDGTEFPQQIGIGQKID